MMPGAASPYLVQPYYVLSKFSTSIHLPSPPHQIPVKEHHLQSGIDSELWPPAWKHGSFPFRNRHFVRGLGVNVREDAQPELGRSLQ